MVGLFSGILIGRVVPTVSLLQFAYDTLVIGEDSHQNIWVLKSILCASNRGQV